MMIAKPIFFRRKKLTRFINNSVINKSFASNDAREAHFFLRKKWTLNIL